jgi:ribose transport system substrate-binding protein
MKEAKRNWRFLFFIALSILLLLAGCSSSSTTQSSEKGSLAGETNSKDKGKPTIGMITINQEALFFTEMVKGAQKAAEKAGVKLIVFNPNNDAVKQNNAVEDFINQGVDAVIINAIDTNGIVPAMEKASQAGIPVISVDSIVDSKAVNVQIGVDNRKASQELGVFFNDYAKKNLKGKVKMGVVGALNSTIQVDRQDGFIETVKKTPDLKVVDIVDGQNVQEKALTAAENLLIGNPDLHAVFATGEPAFIGLAAAIKSQQKEKSVKLFGWDLSKQIIEGIDAGWVQGVIQQHPDKYGEESVNSAVKLIHKESVPKDLAVPATIVTKENVDQFRESFK